MNETSAETVDRSAYRIMDLAEFLYNLQHTPGFDECTGTLRVLMRNWISAGCFICTKFLFGTLSRAA